MGENDGWKISSMDSFTMRWLHDRLHNRIAVNEQDGSVLVYVPAGEFKMGDGQGNDCPPHRVNLSAYWIGVYCVTNAQYRKFVEATGHPAADDSRYRKDHLAEDLPRFVRFLQLERYRKNNLADHPAANVSWDDAVAYANWAGCELPSEAQWEKAARGPLGLIYPWGKDWDGTKYWNNNNRSSEETCLVCSYPGGTSGYGTYNQNGNVWEWCADWYDKGYYRQSPACDPRGPDGGLFRVIRGGSWGFVAPSLCRAALRYWLFPGRRLGYVGFRLVRSAS